MIKKSISVILLLCLVLSFASCAGSGSGNKNTEFEETKETLPAYEEFAFYAKENLLSAKPDQGTLPYDSVIVNERVYVAYDKGICSYELTSGERRDIVTGAAYTAICGTNKGFAAYCNDTNSVIIYSEDGKKSKEYSLDGTDITPWPMKNEVKADITKRLLRVNENESKIYIGYTDENIGSMLYEYSVDNSKLTDITYSVRGKSSYYKILDMVFTEKECAYIFLTSERQKQTLIKYDLTTCCASEKENFSSLNGAYYDKTDGSLYFSFGNFIKKYSDGTIETVTVTDVTKYEEFSENNTTVVPNNIRRDGDYIFFYDINHGIGGIMNTFVKDTVNLYIRGTNMDVYIDKYYLLMRSKYGVGLNVVGIPEDMYYAKLNLKLLSGESDLDVFMVTPQAGNMNFNNILKNKVYAPLGGYSEIAELYGSMYAPMTDIMSIDGEIFGIASGLYTYSLLAAGKCFTEYGYDVPAKNWSISDMWELCDEMVRRGEKDITLFGDMSLISGFSFDFAQESIDGGSIDREKLEDIFVRLKKYYDAGILCPKDDSVSRDKALLSSAMNPFYAYSYVQWEYPENGFVNFPSEDGRSYCVLNSCYILNSASDSKDSAAKLLYELGKERLYDDDGNSCAFGRDYEKERPQKYASLSDEAKKYVSSIEDCISGISPYTFDFGDMSAFLYGNINKKLLSGDISPEEAAKSVCDYIEYNYFE